MNNDSKNTIILSMMLIFYLGIFVFAFFYSGNINPIVFILVTQIAISFWYFPRFNSRYRSLYTDVVSYKVNDFFPVFNELNTLSPGIALFGLILIGLCLLFGVFIAIPSMMTFLGEDFIYMADIYLPKIAIVLMFAFNLLVGIGLTMVKKNIDEIYNDELGDVDYAPEGFVGIIVKINKIFPYIMGILLVLPVLKLLPMLFMLDKVESILKIRGVN